MAIIIITIISGLIVGSWASGRQVAAEALSVTVTKRVSVATDTSEQRTVPLAGARYQLTHVVAAKAGVDIDPFDVSTYRASDSAPLDITLVTDQRGIATLSGSPLVFGHYLLRELRTAQVTAPALPVLVALSADTPAFAYSPKSGLVDAGAVSGSKASAKAQDARIMQTSGSITPLPWRRLLALGLVVLLSLAALAAGLRHRREVSAIDSHR